MFAKIMLTIHGHFLPIPFHQHLLSAIVDKIY